MEMTGENDYECEAIYVCVCVRVCACVCVSYMYVCMYSWWWCDRSGSLSSYNMDAHANFHFYLENEMLHFRLPQPSDVCAPAQESERSGRHAMAIGVGQSHL